MTRSKQFVADFVTSMPLFKQGVGWLRGTGSPIFMFHRIIPESEPCHDAEMATSPKIFAAFLDWACDRYQVVPLEELIRSGGKRANTRKALCAITFDDGWQDNFLHVFPLLRQRQLSVTIFLPVRFIGTDRRFWQERLWFLFRERGDRDTLRNAFDRVSRGIPWCPPLAGWEPTYSGVRRLLLSRASSEADAFVDRLEEATGTPAAPPGRTFLNWEEVQTMQNGGASFGSHTLNHTLLTNADPETARREIQDSRSELEDRLGKPVAGFSYPWGRASGLTRQQVQEAGYRFAVTTDSRLVSSPVDRWLLPRMAVSNSYLRGQQEEFAARRADFHVARAALHSRTEKKAAGCEGGLRERLRIGLVIDFIDAWEEGGTEKQVGKLLSALDPKYFAPELYFLRPSANLAAKDFPCPVHAGTRACNGKWSRSGALRGLIRLFRRQKPHIVQTFFRDGTYYGTVAAWIAGAPCIVISRRNAGYWKATRDRLALKIVNRLADSWQCNSRSAFESLRVGEGVSRDRIEILPNALDLAGWRAPTNGERLAARRELDLPGDSPVFVSVANLFPVKDPEAVVKAAEEVRRVLPGARFLLVGEGPLRAPLEERIQRSNLRDVVLLIGARSDLRPYLASADIGLLASRSEGCSNSLLEYMAMGLPSVVSDVEGNREVVRRLFFESGNASDLAAKILMLWSNAELRAQMRQEYRRQALEYGTEIFAQRAQAYYFKLATRHSVSRQGM